MSLTTTSDNDGYRCVFVLPPTGTEVEVLEGLAGRDLEFGVADVGGCYCAAAALVGGGAFAAHGLGGKRVCGRDWSVEKS